LKFCAGDIVVSKAGRDKDKHFVALSVTEDGFVYVADGKLRRADNPKRKKWKHLENTGNASEFIKNKLRTGVRVTNPDLKKELEKFDLNV